MRAVTSAGLFGALMFAVSYLVWLAIVAVLITVGVGGGAIFAASGALAAVTGVWFGFDYWRTNRRDEGPYWQKIVRRD